MFMHPVVRLWRQYVCLIVWPPVCPVISGEFRKWNFDDSSRRYYARNIERIRIVIISMFLLLCLWQKSRRRFAEQQILIWDSFECAQLHWRFVRTRSEAWCLFNDAPPNCNDKTYRNDCITNNEWPPYFPNESKNKIIWYIQITVDLKVRKNWSRASPTV